eukprot:m.333884 g.333884  ORF g.333884 m.333884 type:complete len:688 (-) comp17240_c0_seq1:115-2178(-)
MSLKGLTICISGSFSVSRAQMKLRIEEEGGKVAGSLTKAVTHLLSSEDEVAKGTAKVLKAQDTDVPIVTEEFIDDSIEQGSPVDADDYIVGGGGGGKKKKPAKKAAAKKAAPKKAAGKRKADEPAKKSGKGKAAKKAKGGDDSPLEGKKISFTGTLQTMKRAEAQKKAEAAGAKFSKTVTKDTDILVAASGAGSKIAEAEAKGVEVWTEDQFVAALDGEAPEPMEVDEGEDDEEEEEEAPPPKKKAAAKKTAAKKKAVSVPAEKPPAAGGSKQRRADRAVPDASVYSVYEDYDIKLNQTNIDHGSNNNKFYIIQVLEGKGSFWHWNRWGRVGETGQSKLEMCGSAADAIKKFEKKFKDKTKNSWADIANFQKVPGKYELVEIDPDDDGGESADAALGKLSKGQIEKGQKVLEDIRSQLEGGSGKSNLATLSSRFYSLIPTVTGRQKPVSIDNMEILQAKESLLEFWLRMGFEDMQEDEGVTPISGILERPLPTTLHQAASNISDAYSIKSSVDKGATLAKAKAGKPVRSMDKELYGSILLYTGNSIYSQLNAALRSENRKAVQKYFNYLRLLFEAMDCMPKGKRTLWRGISVDLFDQYEPGKTITWWSVSSCTADKSVAQNFMNGCGSKCTLVTVDCTTAMDISALSFYSNEKESLLAPGTMLKVKSRKRNGLIAEIHMEEVGRQID